MLDYAYSADLKALREREVPFGDMTPAGILGARHVYANAVYLPVC